MQKIMSHWSRTGNLKPQGDNCVWKESIIPGYIDRNWCEGSEVSVLGLGGIRENSTEVLHSSGVLELTWEKTEDSKTNKKQLRQHCLISYTHQFWVWVTTLMHSASKEFGDELLCLICPSWLENTFCSSSFTSDIYRPESFHVEATHFSFSHLSI